MPRFARVACSPTLRTLAAWLGLIAVTLVALPGGSSYHRDDCSMVQGKRDAKVLSASSARRQGLKPCRLCEPQTASARA